MKHDVSFIALTRFDPRYQVRMTAPDGASIADLVAIAAPGALAEHLRVTIGDAMIPVAVWRRVRPKAGAVVVIRAVPRGDSDVLRSVLLIAVTIAAVAVGQFWLGPIVAGAFGATGAAATTIAGVTSSVLVIGTTLLVNALIPPRPALSQNAPSPTYSIQGWRNVANPDGVVPSVLGTHRMAPPYAALPYTEVVGDDQYITAAFNFGYGPVNIRNPRIGETPLSDFQDVYYEVRGGSPGDAPLTLYTEQVIEEALSAGLTVKAGATKRVTASDVTGVSVDIVFAGGLVAIRSADKKSRQLPMTVSFTLRQRPFGSSTWQNLAPIEITGAQAGKALRRTIRWNFPARGRWEIEITRTTADFDDADQTNSPVQVVSRSTWATIRSYRPEYPIAFDQPLALAAVRIRASEQLNGSLDDFNADVSVICRDWDGSTWVVRETQNPASLFRHVLQGPAISYPLQDGEIAALEDWHDFCRIRGLTYNRVHDYESSVLDVLGDIAAAGRASPHDTGTSWGVVIDRALTLIEGHISPRNSWGFAGERSYVERPDAFRVSFLDETNSFQSAERIVPWPGFVGDPVVTESLSMPGITNPDLIWMEARRRQYELDHRPDTYTVNQDFEHIVHMRGSLVRLSHDVLDKTQKSARVKAVDGNIVTIDEWVTMTAGQSYACRFRRDDGASLLRTVTTVAGDTQTLNLTGTGDLPAVGDLAFFGIASRESSEVIVKGIEVSDNLTGRLTLVDHAPQIEALTDAEVPPPWNGRAGGPVVVVGTEPPVPTITAILSSQQVGAGPNSVTVMLAPGSGPISTAIFEIRHRMVGAPGWSTTTVSAGAASASLTGYVSGDTIEVNARAKSYSGTPSAYAATQTHEIGINDTVVPPISSFSADHLPSGLWRFAWAAGSVAPGREPAEIAGYKIRAKLGVWASFDDLDDLHSDYLSWSPWESSEPASDEIHTFGVAAITESGARGVARVILGGTWRNLLEHSNDPQDWPGSATSVGFGAAVSDPEGGMAGRAITFGSNAGRINAVPVVAGSLQSRTFTGSVHLRAAGKAKIMVQLLTEGVTRSLEVALTSVWQRVDLSLTGVSGDTTITLRISNEASSGLSNTAAGIVEIFGGMVEMAGSPTAYQSRP